MIKQESIQTAFSSVFDKVNGWIESFIVMLPNVLVAILVLVLFTVVGKLLAKLFERVFRQVSNNVQIMDLLSTLLYLAVLAAGVFVALGILKLDKTVTSLLAGVGIIGLALGFAFQDLAANFMAGVVMSIRSPFRRGDIISTNDFLGTVREISLRSTLLQTFEGQMVLIPNKEVFGNPIVNYSQTSKRRIDLRVGVSYNDDLEHVKQATANAIAQLDGLLESAEIEVFFAEFGASSINFDVRFWIPFSKQRQFLKARSDAVIAIKKTFDAEGITIPFPIRTLDFGEVDISTLLQRQS